MKSRKKCIKQMWVKKMTRQITVEGSSGPLELSIGEKVCVPHNIKTLGGQSVFDLACIADQFTNGQEGVHVCYGTPYGTVTIVVRGQYDVQGELFGQVRAVWRGDSGSKQQIRGELPVYKRFPEQEFPEQEMSGNSSYIRI